MKFEKQYKVIKCPFCDKGNLNIIVIPDSIRVRRAFAASNSKPIPQRHKGDVIVSEKECSFCHKTDKEIEKALIEMDVEYKPKSKEELKKQLEELGLTGKF